VRQQVELAAVVEPVARAAERHDAVTLVAPAGERGTRGASGGLVPGAQPPEVFARVPQKLGHEPITRG
jgi:hypothetical protein